MADPYVDPASGLLSNRLGITDAEDLRRAEAYLAYHAEIRLYAERTSFARYDLTALRTVHRRLFGAIYPWAGELRTVDLSKGRSPFARAQHVRAAAEQVFAQAARDDQLRQQHAEGFAGGAGRLLADLNALHPFREGNGRGQRAFLQLLANDAGFQLRWGDVDPAENTALSEAAMSDAEAFVPLMRRIVTRVARRLSPSELRLARHDPPGIGL